MSLRFLPSLLGAWGFTPSITNLTRPRKSLNSATRIIRQQCLLDFHTSASARLPATLIRKGRQPVQEARRRKNAKMAEKVQRRSAPRTRLAKDLQPKGKSAGKYVVAPKQAKESRGMNPDAINKSKEKTENFEKSSIEVLLDEEFDRSVSHTIKYLTTKFTSPPLSAALAQSVADVLGPHAKPTPIQALALKHMFSLVSSQMDNGKRSLSSQEGENAKWKAFLLASETGSGKSFAYLLPMLQYLKQTEGIDSTDRTHAVSAAPSINSAPPLLNPRAIVLAPTHELTRQLASFAKSLVHHGKLRVLCASRGNFPSTFARSAVSHSNAVLNYRGSGSARQMKQIVQAIAHADNENSGAIEFPEGNSVAHARPVDVLTSTPSKALEMVRGWGWDKIIGKDKENTDSALHHGREFKPGKPEMRLDQVEFVVVDEADILFDPDFREMTISLLSDISAARGYPVSSNTTTSNAASKGAAGQRTSEIEYPFHLVLTSATIPAALSSYLTTYHPTLTRLVSPNLHRLPSTLHTEHVSWSSGNRLADIDRRLRRVWAEDALRGPDLKTGRVHKSKVIVFCNRASAVETLGKHLEEKGVRCATLSGSAGTRKHGSNRHLEGFLKQAHSSDFSANSGDHIDDALEKSPSPTLSPSSHLTSAGTDGQNVPNVLITTSLLSRGLDFSPNVRHVFIVDAPRNMVDFLHRAGRAGRAGEQGKVVIFGKLKGRGSMQHREVRKKVRALAP